MINYKEKDIVKCMVTAIESYGFFVNTEQGYSGLVHISEIATGYVKDVKAYVNIGDVIYAQIININEDGNQLGLSIKNINYKSSTKEMIINDKNDFLPLKNALEIWMKEKELEYNIKTIDKN